MKSSLDSAFLRRLRFIVNFPVPGVEERTRMWRQIFPVAEPEKARLGVPVEGLDYERLARLNLTGGNIHNVALHAAFLAAEAQANVTMPLVLAAARSEFQKLQRPINAADFHWPAVQPNGQAKAPTPQPQPA
jgi:SpoVK/Ycf46/Vps4 family AAA+-type ATPase